MEKIFAEVSENGLLLEENSNHTFSTIFHYADGQKERFYSSTPAEDLIAAVEIDYGAYRRELKCLREGHPLFEPELDIHASVFEDFVAEALLLPSILHEIDPVSFFVLGELLNQSLQMEDDGSADFFLRAGTRLLRVLEEPIRIQTYLRNIFEITFDGMERASQQGRFEKLRSIYPDVANFCDPVLLPAAATEDRVFVIHSLFGLRLLELALYFQQDEQRIARCDYCWGYFIPKTKKATRYCDRTIDGFPCKQRGSRFQRNESHERDGALLICKQLRDRMYARYLRYTVALPWERDRLIPMDDEQYNEWSENARLARMEYLDGKLTAEDFLRRIDTTHELESYEVSKTEPITESVWQERVAADLCFDSESRYPESLMCLDLGKPNAEWEILTADDQRRWDQQGHQSLREKYGKA